MSEKSYSLEWIHKEIELLRGWRPDVHPFNVTRNYGIDSHATLLFEICTYSNITPDKFVRLLSDNPGADFEIKNKEGATVVEWSLQSGMYARCLLKAGASMERRRMYREILRGGRTYLGYDIFTSVDEGLIRVFDGYSALMYMHGWEKGKKLSKELIRMLIGFL